MIEHTETIIKLDSKEIGIAIRQYIGTKGVVIPAYAKVVIDTERASYGVGGPDFLAINATITVKTGTKALEDTK